MKRSFIFGSILIVILAASLRLYHLGQRSLWLDEAIAANISRGTLHQTLTLTRGLHSAPIVDPLILYGVEKVNDGPVGVRTPAAIASILAVVLMLCFVKIPSVDSQTAVLSGLMMAVSAAQIRYAQEVREYSLSVLYAAVLLFVFLSYRSKKEEDRSPILLCVALFFAPLVQYGLVLFSCGVLSALLILAFSDNNSWRSFRHIMGASSCLALGGLLSFFLTLRYQWGDNVWYLKDYFWQPGSGIFGFIKYNTHHLITFLLPGAIAGSISVLAILVSLMDWIRVRKFPAVIILACTACAIVLACALLRVYPYGGIRQCLFLAPVLCLAAATGVVTAANKFKGRANSLVFAAVLCLVIISGVLQIRLLKPYAEVEDIQQVLTSLRSRIQPGDAVYIYPNAVFSVDFYVKKRDLRFIYGNYHQDAPEEYVPEMLGAINPNVNRLWLVFSHPYRAEDQRILHDLSKGWKVEPVLFVTGSALYLAYRCSAIADGPPTHSADKLVDVSNATPIAERLPDTFWDWNIRNSRYPAR